MIRASRRGAEIERNARARAAVERLAVVQCRRGPVLADRLDHRTDGVDDGVDDVGAVE